MMSAGLDESERAFEFLGLTGDERFEVQRARGELEAELGLRGEDGSAGSSHEGC